jgi:hypothetical protein
MTRRAKKHSEKPGLEVYAFWTGFASTIISLLHVMIVASK